MRTSLHIHYFTTMGQRVVVEAQGSATPLTWTEGHWWTGTVDLAPGAEYSYAVHDGDDLVATEDGHPRRAPLSDADVALIDRWRTSDPSRRSRTSALFTTALASRFDSPRGDSGGRITLRVLEPGIRPGWQLRVVGSTDRTGNWNPNDGIDMRPSPFPWWEASFDVPEGEAFAYKYVVMDGDGVVAWEPGEDRIAPATAASTVIADDEIRNVPGWRGAGLAIPVFSLRSSADVGVGQFTDLKALADWAAVVGIRLIQLLPVNDTVLNHDWDDSYPYNPVSVQALHPLYIDLDAIPDAGIATEVEAVRHELNDLPEIDYVRVMEAKWQLLRRAYDNVAPELGADQDFAAFFAAEQDWLVPYSAWAALRDRHGTPDFRRWGENATYRPDRIEAMALPGSAHYDDLRFHWFVQYHLHRQLTDAADYARSRGVALKGDLPIGVAPESAEVWQAPELFHVGAQTGAPPDAFAVRGQNWEFPTYNWDRMAEDGYRWWRDRFTALARYVDAYRIDHVLGFFRIWEIRHSADDGLLGHFRPSLPLSADEVRAAIGDVDLAELVRPAATEDTLAGFGPHADRARDGFFLERPEGITLMPGVATQRRILRAFELGVLDDLPEEDRQSIQRRLMDVAADVLLLEVGDGFQPRISWQDTTHYASLNHEQRAAFDALAVDFFHHRHREQWEEQGRRTLPPILDATDLLACGEDLGMVPELVPRIMNEFGLLSLEIERMPKRLGEWIADPADAPYLSVVSPSTHDTTTLRMWWGEDPALTSRYWHEALLQIGDAPDSLNGETARALIRRQLASPAMLCVIPMSDLFAIDEDLRRLELATERINDPANRHNKWRYRLHMTLDELAAAADFNDAIRAMVAAAGR